MIRPTELFAKILKLQLTIFEQTKLRYWSSTTLVDDIMVPCKTATSSDIPFWFYCNNKCKDHREESLRFLIKIKLHASARKNIDARPVKKPKSYPESKCKVRKRKNILHV